MATKQSIRNLQKMEQLRKDINKFCTECVAGEYQRLLDEMERIFGDQLNAYIIAVFELDDFISNNILYFNDDLIEKTNKIIEKVRNCETMTRKSLDEMEIFFDEVESNGKVNIARIVEKKAVNEIPNKAARTLFKRMLQNEMMNIEKTLLIYYKEQRENITKYYEMFDIQNDMLDRFERFCSFRNADFELFEEKQDVKRFTCTYDQMAGFLTTKGYQKIRQNGTSHAIYKNKIGHSLPLPNKRGEMSATTMSLILNQCNSSRNELGTFLKCE